MSIKTTLIFLLVMILAYLPISSMMFYLKNDAFTGYFPPKFYISEAINNMTLPWWNPYINYGLPQYGDMNSGFWSPITWLISYTFRYNAYSFTIELLAYLFLAGLGMFQLCRSYRFTKTVSYIIGISFLCCGYMVGHLQHFNWISGAAFLPWALWSYHQLINKFSYKNAIISALLFYLLISSAHPGIIIGSLYFFTAYIIFYFFKKKQDEPEQFTAKSFIRKNAWMTGLLLLFSIGMITGYADIIPYMTRGQQINTLSGVSNSFTPQSMLTSILPMGGMKSDRFYMTDISMRNIYFGLVPLIFLIPTLVRNKNNYQRFFFYITIFFLILSFGSYLRYVTNFIVPLSGFVRMPAEFMIFPIFSLLLMVGFSMNQHVKEGKDLTDTYRQVIAFLQLLIMIAMLVGLIGVILTGNSVFLHAGNISAAASLTGKVKAIIDGLSIWDAFIIQGIIQLLLLREIKWALKRKNYKQLIKIAAIDIALACLMNVPFTGAGQASVKDVQRAINKVPEGFVRPFLLPPTETGKTLPDKHCHLLGNWGFYSKQIGFVEKPFYPVALKTAEKIYQDDSISRFANQPYLFTTGQLSSDSIQVKYFKGNFVDLKLNTPVIDTLVFQQSVYKYWKCSINGEGRKPIRYKGVFNAVVLSPGKNDVKFYFNPMTVSTSYQISKYALLICLLYLVIVMVKRVSPS